MARSLPRDRPGAAAADPDEQRVAAARRRGDVAAAGLRGDEAAVRAALADPEPTVRAGAVAALARMGMARHADAAAARSDPSPLVRRAAGELGSALPPDGAVGLLEDPEASVVEAACYAAGELGDPAAIGRLSRVATSHHDPLCREAAVAALGAIGLEEGLSAVLAACNDLPAVRRRAVVALAAFEGPEVDAALRARLEDRDWQVRQAAEELLES